MNTPIRANSGQKRTWVQNVKVAILPLLLTVIIVLVAEASKADIPTWQEPHVVKNIISQTDDFVLGSTSVIDSRLYFSVVGQGIADNVHELWRTDGTPVGTILLEQHPEWYPGDLHALDKQLVFTTRSEEYGTELWTSNGSPGNARLLIDLVPGPASPNLESLVVSGDYLYFMAYTEEHRTQLWRTDGTAIGTIRLTDLDVFNGASPPNNLTAYKGELFFTLQDSQYYATMMKSDGTVNGTTPVTQIGDEPINVPIADFTISGNLMYFRVGSRIWRSDGTQPGTYIVYTPTGGRFYEEMVGSESNLFFILASESGGSYELWKSGGTIATTIKVSSLPGYYGWPETAGDRLYFLSNDEEHGIELWTSDGTSTGTKMVKDIFPGPDNGVMEKPVAVGNVVYFSANDGRVPIASSLWRSDGTTNGTLEVSLGLPKSVDPGPMPNTDFNGRLFFTAVDLANGREPWLTSVSGMMASFLKDINDIDIIGSNPINLNYVNNLLFFLTSAGLWKSDGSETGTSLLIENRYLKKVVRQDASEFGIAGDNLYFLVDEYDKNQVELWRTDGTLDGTIFIKDVSPMYRAEPATEMTDVNGLLYFAKAQGQARKQLWRSDGTTNGTVFVATPNLNDSESSEIAQITGIGAKLFFTATDGISGRELWTSDGTTAGTRMVKDIRPGAWSGSNPDELTVLNNRVYFTADNGVGGVELWRSDGTAQGTFMVKDINPGAASSNPQELVIFDGFLYFSAADASHGRELWRSDGSSDGTRMVKDILPVYGSSPLELTPGLDWLYFVAFDNESGYQVWKTDGTATGTNRVTVVEYNEFAWPNHLVAVENTLYFSVVHQTQTFNYQSDGTDTGTFNHQKAFPNFGGYDYRYYTPTAGRLFFTAENLTKGNEPFVQVLGLTRHEPAKIYIPERGVAKPYQLALNLAPTSSVTVNLSSDDKYLSISPSTVNFTPQNWFLPQTITVQSFGDDKNQGTRTSMIDHKLTSADATFNGEMTEFIVVVREWRYAFIPSIMR
jgi:trimeric autotransporter adhesin